LHLFPFLTRNANGFTCYLDTDARFPTLFLTTLLARPAWNTDTSSPNLNAALSFGFCLVRLDFNLRLAWNTDACVTYFDAEASFPVG